MFILEVPSEKYAMLDYDQTKAINNLELAMIEPLESMIKSLGFIEPMEMMKIRENFRLTKPQDSREIKTQTNQYLEIAEKVVDQDPGRQSRLVLSILLVIFYSPSQNDMVRQFFVASLEDAINIAYQEEYQQIWEKLELLKQKLIGK